MARLSGGLDLGLHRNLFLDVVHRQYFDHSVPFAILAGVIVVAAVAARLAGARGPAGDTRSLLLACAAWITIPNAISADLLGDRRTLYYPRYLFSPRLRWPWCWRPAS